jgi:hypothetical protein
VQEIIFSTRHFAKTLLRNMPFPYVFLDIRDAGMIFRNKKKFGIVYRHIPAHMYVRITMVKKIDVWPQFRDVVSPHRHEQQKQIVCKMLK